VEISISAPFAHLFAPLIGSPGSSFSKHILTQGMKAMESPNRGGVWDRFLEACRRAGVEERKLRWYVARVERYLKAHGQREPGDHGAADVQAYLERAGSEARLPGWLL
jgi:hypothetical protein